MKMRVILMPLFFLTAASAGELGIGREADIPDAPPPTEPASSEAPESALQELLEWVDTDVEQ